LNSLTRVLFPAADDAILDYLNDDGTPVEPIFYAPIIPMVLVNGSKGIGTGFSTDIMSYDPLQIIDYLKNKLLSISEDDEEEFIPYYEGFQGKISKLSAEKFLIKGVYEKVGTDKIRVTELPVGYWTEDFKELLEELIEPTKDGKKLTAIVKDYDDMSKDTNVDFTITFAKGKLEELEQLKADHDCNGVEKLLKLYTTNTTTNMHLFDANDTLHKYEKVSEIIDTYYETRLKMYGTRKEYMINALEKELVMLSNKARYIQENLDGTIDLRKKKREEVNDMLQGKGYDQMDEDCDYKYLVRMPMDSVTSENVEKLLKNKGDKEAELEMVKSTSSQQMWMKELDSLKVQLIEYKENRARLMAGEETKKKKVVVKKAGGVKKNLIISDE
jgi:DNA topoisomerase-2